MDYYGILGIERRATQKEIKEAFRKQALRHHPDMHSQANKAAQDRAAAKFREISDAYKVLSDERTRAVYDRYGRTAAAQSRKSSSYSAYGSARQQRQWYDEAFNEWSRYQHARSRHQNFMRWRDFSTRFGRYLAIQTLVSSLFLMFLISVGTATNAAWDYNNRGKRFEDIIDRRYKKHKGPD